MRRSRALSLLAPLALLGALAACDAGGEFQPYTTVMKVGRVVPVGSGELDVEIAADARSREEGLKNRTTLPADAGMLFVFPTSGIQRIWMKDCYFPISAAFLDADGTVLNIEDMEPFEEAPGAVSHGEALYVLEAHAGWFAQKGLRPGDKVTFPDWIHEISVE